MAAIEPDQLSRILAMLPAADALVVSAALEAPSESRRRRLDCRDALIRQALAGAEGASLTVRASALSRRLNHVGKTDDLARQVKGLNGGKPMSWQHIARIVRTGRSPDLCKNTDGIAQAAWSMSPP